VKVNYGKLDDLLAECKDVTGESRKIEIMVQSNDNPVTDQTHAGIPTVYVIAGPNGAGKTTFATEFLPDFVHCREFLNADLIAAGLSPFSPETQNFRAGRLAHIGGSTTPLFFRP
jgi:hypothetical protein